MVTYEELDDNYVTDSGHTKETYDYNSDIKSAPFIEIKEEIDVLCLDGGHFSTIQEWEMFKDKIKVIILDDTNTSKATNILKEIQGDKTWNIIHDGNIRNGELVAAKKTLSLWDKMAQLISNIKKDGAPICLTASKNLNE